LARGSRSLLHGGFAHLLWDSQFPIAGERYLLVVVWGVGVPASLAGVWAMSIWRRSVDRARRIRRGHCPYCDYDCRATPDRCPECGTTAVEAPARNPADGSG